jgi:hypothetical protein
MTALASAAAVLLPGQVPIGVGRDEARGAAVHELLSPIYHRDDPTFYDRAKEWVGRLLARLLRATVDAAPGGAWGLLVIVLVIVAVVGLVIWRHGAPARAFTHQGATLLAEDIRTGAQIRASADSAAAEGRWTLAVQERFRATVRGLEERTIIDRRPGWTADEAASAAGSALPALATDLSRGARVFDTVTYGARPADAAMHERLKDLDGAAQRSSASGAPARSPATFGVPL